MLRIQLVACFCYEFVCYLIVPRHGRDELYIGWVRDWDNTGYSLKYNIVSEYIIHSILTSIIKHVNYSCITYIIRSSRTSNIHHVVHLRQFQTFSQIDFFTKCDLMLSLSISCIKIATYVFFLIFYLFCPSCYLSTSNVF